MKKASLVAKKLQVLFPNTPEGKLHHAVIEKALRDGVDRNAGARQEALRYLRTNAASAAIFGIEKDYIIRVCETIGYDIHGELK